MAALTGKKLTTAIIINLLALGVLSFELIPEYYCDIEDKTTRCVYVSPNNITCTSVIPSKDNSTDYRVLDDKCQVGQVYGSWQRRDSYIQFPRNITSQYTTSRPVIAWNVNYIRTTANACYARGECMIPVDKCE